MAKPDVRVINPVLRSIVETLEKTAGLDAKAGPASLKSDAVGRGNITGVMTITGANVNGSIGISFGEDTVLKLTEKVLEEKHEKIDGSVIDMIGEITNMVVGRAAALLNQQGEMVRISLPTIIIGQEHLVAHKFTGPKILLPFQTDIGEFHIEMVFQE